MNLSIMPVFRDGAPIVPLSDAGHFRKPIHIGMISGMFLLADSGALG
jgi:hypothetical protein